MMDQRLVPCVWSRRHTPHHNKYDTDAVEESMHPDDNTDHV